ncbi:DNA-binding GntR family transcriptional regulator [Virgibacillus natechei]|uniref:DNA-binding GntR family transcriptional regulator n=1 Tax=Virgibacillus natechei TaxID=1216297 RepID=A0ABS4IG83_9BACI|nr:GntR family transcriptional regulator [Virgibacillus natechei]MBP1969336.1 DNA-binding GntR family transcriptional regulator [Virgibacillus natechei]UZD12487.1 GntR family transcriptional regulator [Virgibacillus natechei]
MYQISKTQSQPRITGSTRDFVYNTLKKRIIEWELEPGTKISENEIAIELNVSRTPAREAFLMLAQEELIGIYPQKGSIVAEIDLELVEEGRFVRENVERAIVREACKEFGEDQLFQLETNITMQELCLKKGSHHRLFELDEEFHRLLFEGCNKIRTWKLIRQMNSHFDRLRVLRLASNPDWNVVVTQHKELFNFISNGEQDLAEKLIIEHLNLVNFEKEELKLHYSSYFK